MSDAWLVLQNSGIVPENIPKDIEICMHHDALSVQQKLKRQHVTGTDEINGVQEVQFHNTDYGTDQYRIWLSDECLDSVRSKTWQNNRYAEEASAQFYHEKKTTIKPSPSKDANALKQIGDLALPCCADIPLK